MGPKTAVSVKARRTPWIGRGGSDESGMSETRCLSGAGRRKFETSYSTFIDREKQDGLWYLRYEFSAAVGVFADDFQQKFDGFFQPHAFSGFFRRNDGHVYKTADCG